MQVKNICFFQAEARVRPDQTAVLEDEKDTPGGKFIHNLEIFLRNFDAICGGLITQLPLKSALLPVSDNDILAWGVPP